MSICLVLVLGGLTGSCMLWFCSDEPGCPGQRLCGGRAEDLWCGSYLLLDADHTSRNFLRAGLQGGEVSCSTPPCKLQLCLCYQDIWGEWCRVTGNPCVLEITHARTHTHTHTHTHLFTWQPISNFNCSIKMKVETRPHWHFGSGEQQLTLTFYCPCHLPAVQFTEDSAPQLIETISSLLWMTSPQPPPNTQGHTHMCTHTIPTSICCCCPAGVAQFQHESDGGGVPPTQLLLWCQHHREDFQQQLPLGISSLMFIQMPAGASQSWAEWDWATTLRPNYFD